MELALLIAVPAALLAAAHAIAAEPGPVLVASRQHAPRWASPWRRLLGRLAARLGMDEALTICLLICLVVLVGAGWALGTLLQASASTEILDRPIQRFLVAHRGPWLTSLLGAVTVAGDNGVLVSLVLGTGLVWWWRRHRFRPLALLAAAYLGARVVETSVKVLTHRPRPPAAEAVAEFTRFAFPSGHAVYALAVYGMLALLVIRRWEKGRMPVIIAATVLVGLIGISRVYLGAHWLTDTLGGFILGGLWLSSLVSLIRAADELKDADRLARPTGRRANEDGDAKTPRRERENEQERF